MHLETSSFSMHVSRNSSKAEFILQRFHDHCSVVSDYSRFGSIELTYKFFIDIFSELNEYKSEKTFELIFFFFSGDKRALKFIIDWWRRPIVGLKWFGACMLFYRPTTTYGLNNGLWSFYKLLFCIMWIVVKISTIILMFLSDKYSGWMSLIDILTILSTQFKLIIHEWFTFIPYNTTHLFNALSTVEIRQQLMID